MSVSSIVNAACSQISGIVRTSAKPALATHSSPAYILPGYRHSPHFAKPKVTVMSALTAQPMTCPSPALIPDGVSTATIRLPVSFAALIFAIICSYLPVIVLDKPMPKTASIIQLYSPAGMSFTNIIPSFCKIAHCRFNSSVPFPSSAVVYTSAEIPRSVS